jgi:8-oxo-dGTP pyrophosphatase MutT (NUDIX family)
MSETSSKPLAKPRQASTVLLVRDSDVGIQAFMLERNKAIKFASGALVFPGGKVDAADADPALLAHLQGAAEMTSDARALRVGAIREVFEESGVLLARKRGAQLALSKNEADTIGSRYRAKLLAGEITIQALVEQEDLELLTQELIYFAHWITPNIRPTRFDTHFYLALLPPGQNAEHDGDESTSSCWIATRSAAADISAAGYSAMSPTLMNLEKVSRSETVADAIAQARTATVVTVQPEVHEAADGTRTVSIPEEAGYNSSNYPFKAGWVKS